jgi:hypothetical protein
VLQIGRASEENNYLCTAEHHSRGQKLCSYSIVSQHFIEPEGSLPRLQELSNFPVLSQTNPVHSTSSYFYKIHLNVIHLPTS